MTEGNVMFRAGCPACAREIEVRRPVEEGGWFACPHCGADLELCTLTPPQFELAYDGPEIAGRPRPWRHGWW